MIMVRPQPKLLSKLLGYELTLVSAPAIHDPRHIHTLFSLDSDERRHIVEDALEFRADLVVQIGPVEGLTQDLTASDAEGADDVVLDLVLGCGCKGHDGDIGVFDAKIAEFKVCRSASASVMA